MQNKQSVHMRHWGQALERKYKFCKIFMNRFKHDKYSIRLPYRKRMPFFVSR